jgi:GNAT superfamily N-acetyltransferase
MNYVDRPYDDAAGDFGRLWDFLVQDYADRNGDYSWSVGRIADWKYNLATPRKYSPIFLAKSAHLWLDASERVVAFAINENLDEEIAVFAKQGHDNLFGPVIDWAVERWASYAASEDPNDPCGQLTVYLDEGEEREAAILAERGWEDLGRQTTSRRYDVAAKAAEPIELPDGFRVVSMADDPNFESKVRLYHDAWHQGSPVTQLDLELHEYCRTAPTYDLALDISVVSPDGEHVAGCTAFPDYVNDYAEIERVATRSDYRRQGLAAAAIRACFRAIHAKGLRTAYLTGVAEGAISLYGKLGAIGEWHSHGWQLVVRRPEPARRSGTGSLEELEEVGRRVDGRRTPEREEMVVARDDHGRF